MPLLFKCFVGVEPDCDRVCYVSIVGMYVRMQGRTDAVFSTTYFEQDLLACIVSHYARAHILNIYIPFAKGIFSTCNEHKQRD